MRTVATGSTTVLRPARGITLLAGKKVKTNNFGTVTLSNEIYDKWVQIGVATLGDPIQSYFSLPDGSSACYFERGMIVHRKAGGTFAVYGAIYLQYRNLNDVHSFLGLPKSDEQAAANGGRVSHFENADIYWSGGSGAFEVHGAIRDRYAALGGPGGFLGYPLTNETQIFKNRVEVGRFNRFQGGVIYWSSGTGAWEVHGDIRRKYEDELDGPIGEMGFPTSNEGSTPKGAARYSNFQNGVILWFNSYANMRIIKNLELYIDRIGSKGDDGFLGGGQDVYIIMDISSSRGYHVRERIPKDGDLGSDKTLNRVLPRFGVPTGDMSIPVKFEGWDSDSGFIRGWFGDNDDKLGTVDKTYTADDLWGMNDPATHWAGDFMIVYKVRDVTSYDPHQFRKNLWWNYDNFSTATLSKSQYAQTFRDVDEDESVIWHPFNAAYYELVYKGVAAGGNCFGMCVESIYAQVCRSIYNEPIGRFPPTNGTEPQPGTHNEMINEINIKHGYQVGASFIDWFLGHFISGGTHDPVRCFRESRDQFARGNYPIISLTSDYWGAGGHAVRPYAWDDSTKPWKIKIADPNRPYPRVPNDNDPGNIITIDPDKNTFHFNGAGGTAYDGGAWTGGRMFSIPFNVLCEQPRTPFWEALALLVGGTLLIIGGDASTKNITDGSGKTFFEPNLGHLPEKWADIRKDTNQRIPNMALLPVLHDLSAVLRGRTVLDANILKRLLTKEGPGQVFYLHRPAASHGPEGAISTGVATDVGHAVIAGAVTATTATTAATTGTAVRSGITDVVTGTLLNALQSNEITHEIEGTGTSGYQWGYRSPTMTAVVKANLGSGKVDKVSVSPMNTGNPEVSLLPESDKVVALSVTRWSDQAQRTRGYDVTNLQAKAGAKVRARLEDDGETLMLHSEGGDAKFDLSVRSGATLTPQVQKKQVELKQGEVIRLTPSEWKPTEMVQAPIKMRAFDGSGKNLLREADL